MYPELDAGSTKAIVLPRRSSSRVDPAPLADVEARRVGRLALPDVAHEDLAARLAIAQARSPPGARRRGPRDGSGAPRPRPRNRTRPGRESGTPDSARDGLRKGVAGLLAAPSGSRDGVSAMMSGCSAAAQAAGTSMTTSARSNGEPDVSASDGRTREPRRRERHHERAVSPASVTRARCPPALSATRRSRGHPCGGRAAISGCGCPRRPAAR